MSHYCVCPTSLINWTLTIYIYIYEMDTLSYIFRKLAFEEDTLIEPATMRILITRKFNILTIHVKKTTLIRIYKI